MWLLGIATQTPVDVNLSEARSPFFRDDPRGGTAGLCGAAGLTGGPPCGCPPWRHRFSLARHHVRIPETPAHTCCFLFITSVSAVPERAALARTSLVANHAERPRACGHGYLSSGGAPPTALLGFALLFCSLFSSPLHGGAFLNQLLLSLLLSQNHILPAAPERSSPFNLGFSDNCEHFPQRARAARATGSAALAPPGPPLSPCFSQGHQTLQDSRTLSHL